MTKSNRAATAPVSGSDQGHTARRSDPMRAPLPSLGMRRRATATDSLEREADSVALAHAAPLAHGDWTARDPALSVDGARRAVGARLGFDLSDVSVRSGPLSGAPAGAMARTRHRRIEVAPDALHPQTPIGQALLAHELTHVAQQSGKAHRPTGPTERHLEQRPDQSADITAAPPGMAQYTIGCSSCENVAPPPAPKTFADVQRVFSTSSSAAERTAILDEGITTARSNAAQLFRNAARPPVSALKDQYENETGINISYDNPFIGVSQNDVERAYRAWAENPAESEPPWVLLAIWVKEGLADDQVETATATGFPANDEADARAIYRSLLYYWNLGADVYVSHTAGASGDNSMDPSPGTGAAHDAAFSAQIARQVAAGRLPRDLEAEINATLTVTSAGAGKFNVAASPRFYELSLMLVDAFYREQRDALAADSRVGANPDPGLVYMRWNMRSSSFNAFLDRTPNADPDGSIPSRVDWAFHRNVQDAEYGQPRRNAIRFKYLSELFAHAYNGIP